MSDANNYCSDNFIQNTWKSNGGENGAEDVQNEIIFAFLFYFHVANTTRCSNKYIKFGASMVIVADKSKIQLQYFCIRFL